MTAEKRSEQDDVEVCLTVGEVRMLLSACDRGEPPDFVQNEGLTIEWKYLVSKLKLSIQGAE